MTLLTQILRMLATKGALSKDSLFCLNPTQSYVYKTIRKAVDLNLIKECKYTKKDQRKDHREQHTWDYYVLTAEGLRYIKETCAQEIPWAKYLTAEKTFQVFSRWAKPEEKMRAARKAAVALAFEQVGLPEIVVSFQDAEANANPPLLSEIVISAIEQYQRECGIPSITSAGSISPLNGPRYFPAGNMKRAIKSKYQNVKDIDSARFAGICYQDKTAIYCYAPAKHEDFRWYNHLLENERNVDRLFDLRNYDDRHVNPTGILFVPDAASLIKYISDSKNYLYRYHLAKNVKPLGVGLLRMYVVPMTFEGMAELYRLLTHEFFADRTMCIDDVTNNSLGEYFDKKNFSNEIDSHLFPGIGAFGEYIAIEPHVDVLRLQKILGIAQKHKDQDFCILCPKWAEAYFTTIAMDGGHENVEIVAMDEWLSPDFTANWQTLKTQLFADEGAPLGGEE